MDNTRNGDLRRSQRAMYWATLNTCKDQFVKVSAEIILELRKREQEFAQVNQTTTDCQACTQFVLTLTITKAKPSQARWACVPPKMPVHLILIFCGRTTRRLGSNGESRALSEEVVLRKLTDEAIRLIFDLAPNLDSINQELQFGTQHGRLSCYGLHRYDRIPDHVCTTPIAH